MTEQQEIEINKKFHNELAQFIRANVRDEITAHHATCCLVLVASQMAFTLSGRDAAIARDRMVAVLNLALKHGLKDK